MTDQDYTYKTQPFPHQHEGFLSSRDKVAHGDLWEQGCGKSKKSLDELAYLYEQGRVDALLVVAPDGVHLNWLTDEMPVHFPDRVMEQARCFLFKSSSSSALWHKKAFEQTVAHKGLACMFISYNAFMSTQGKKYVWRFLKKRRALYILDESHFIKSPAAKRTISIVASGKYAPYRRILTGTPVPQGPFDLYSQIRFLDPDFWKNRGLGSFAAFKQFYGVWRTRQMVQFEEGYDPGYDQLLTYKNIPELQDTLKLISHRVTKEQVLNLPPKLYSKRYFELTSEQQRVYRELETEFTTTLESGDQLEAALALVRLLRLQQVICGYVATGAEEPIQRIGTKNPRLDTLVETVEPIGHKVLIWARFREDIRQLADALGKEAVCYYGGQTVEQRSRAKDDFKKGDAKYLLSNPAVGGTGLTFTEAKTAVYYSNSFKLGDRQQSEARNHRAGQDQPVEYIDIIAANTVDTHILEALLRKFDISLQITGDTLKTWLTL